MERDGTSASARRQRRSGKARREQAQRAQARAVQQLLRSFSALKHRGCQSSQLGIALSAALQSDATNASPPPCRYYLQGRCTWGAQCRFLHSGPSNASAQPAASPVPPAPPAATHRSPTMPRSATSQETPPVLSTKSPTMPPSALARTFQPGAAAHVGHPAMGAGVFVPDASGNLFQVGARDDDLENLQQNVNRLGREAEFLRQQSPAQELSSAALARGRPGATPAASSRSSSMHASEVQEPSEVRESLEEPLNWGEAGEPSSRPPPPPLPQGFPPRHHVRPPPPLPNESTTMPPSVLATPFAEAPPAAMPSSTVLAEAEELLRKFAEEDRAAEASSSATILPPVLPSLSANPDLDMPSTTAADMPSTTADVSSTTDAANSSAASSSMAPPAAAPFSSLTGAEKIARYQEFKRKQELQKSRPAKSEE